MQLGNSSSQDPRALAQDADRGGLDARLSSCATERTPSRQLHVLCIRGDGSPNYDGERNPG